MSRHDVSCSLKFDANVAFVYQRVLKLMEIFVGQKDSSAECVCVSVEILRQQLSTSVETLTLPGNHWKSKLPVIECLALVVLTSVGKVSLLTLTSLVARVLEISQSVPFFYRLSLLPYQSLLTTD